ncbi:MAG: catalase [Oscillospiraceae bacterium]|nr:catalase [Oscillospiraceae bacterium]
MQIRAHLRTVTRHRRLVRQYCFKLGLYWQGLTHDLSKFSPTEFCRSIKYYQGFRSPNDQERLENGVSLSWLHHKGRNRHHFEYWIDYCLKPDGGVYIGGCKMPKKYVAEMFCDRIAACRVYQGEKYTDASAYDYHQRSKGHAPIHDETSALLDRWLLMLKEQGEDTAFAAIRAELHDPHY